MLDDANDARHEEDEEDEEASAPLPEERKLGRSQLQGRAYPWEVDTRWLCVNVHMSSASEEQGKTRDV